MFCGILNHQRETSSVMGLTAVVCITRGAFEHKIKFLPFWHFGSPHSRCLSVNIHSGAAAQKNKEVAFLHAHHASGGTLSRFHIFQLQLWKKGRRARLRVYMKEHSEKVVAGVNNRWRAVSLSRGEHLRQVEIGILTRRLNGDRKADATSVSAFRTLAPGTEYRIYSPTQHLHVNRVAVAADYYLFSIITRQQELCK